MTTYYYFRNMGPNTRWLLEPDTSSGAVQSIDNYDITGDGVKDLIIGRVYKWFSFPYTQKSPFEDFKLFWQLFFTLTELTCKSWAGKRIAKKNTRKQYVRITDKETDESWDIFIYDKSILGCRLWSGLDCEKKTWAN